jgi:hypothetical protein
MSAQFDHPWKSHVVTVLETTTTTTTTYANYSNKDAEDVVLHFSPTLDQEFHYLSATCATMHDSEPMLAVGGTEANQDSLRILHFDAESGSYENLAQLAQPDTFCSLSWRGDLLLASSYNGVVYAYTLPLASLRNQKASTSRSKDLKTMQSQTPKQIIHPQIYVTPNDNSTSPLC